jgi:PEP-CTERM motif-containing protein
MRLPIKLLSLAIILTAAWSAKADTLVFTLSGGGDTFTFSLPSNPSPDSGIPGTSFTLMNILITQDSMIDFTADITFSNGGHGGGLEFPLPSSPFPPPINLDLTGPQLYTGSEISPSFSPTVTPFTLSEPNSSDTFTLDITDASTVPEPSTVAMLATGLLALAGTARRKLLAR